MNAKGAVLSIAAFLLAAFGIFIATSGSYQEALRSKIYYEAGEYESAYELAKSAYNKDFYNKLAYTVMMQSEISIRYANYIKRSNEYLEKIQKISKQERIDKANLDRIRMMCEIAVDDYENLKPSNLTHERLQEEARQIRDKFLTLQKDLF